jgi:RNA polymerase sigma factor (sigma-70 family)
MVGMKSRRVIGQIQGLLARGTFGHLSDAQILEQFCRQQSDADVAFETLVQRHGPFVLRTCRRVLGHRAEADDAFQATFLVLARRAGSLQAQDSIGPWLKGVARRIAMKARAAAIRRRIHEQRSAVPIVFDTESERFDLSEPVREAVDGLPEHLRAPIVLCYFERMTYRSAARALGLQEATVRGRLVKARDLLRQRLTRDFEADSPTSQVPESRSMAPAIPLPLLDATTRSALAFSRPTSAKAAITPSVLRMAEGALTMLSVTRFMRLLAGTLVCTAGLAFAGLQAQVQTAPQESAKTLPADQSREPSQDILIVADSIQTKAKDNQVLVDGPGTMSLWVDRNFMSAKLADSPDESGRETTLLRISWTQGMQLIARTADGAGPHYCVARFRGKVTAQLSDRSIVCEDWMRICTTLPVPLERIQLAMKPPASDTLAHHPRTRIARVDAYRKVVVIGHMIDPDRHAIANRQRLLADEMLSCDRNTGEYRVSGKGEFACSLPTHDAKKGAADGPLAPLSHVGISFNTGMTAGWSLEREATSGARVLEFSGDVKCVSTDPSNTQSKLKPGEQPKPVCFVNTQTLRLTVYALSRSEKLGYPARVEADGAALCRQGDLSIGPGPAIWLDLPE